MTRDIGSTDQSHEPRVFDRAVAQRSLQPFVVTAWRDTEDSAHRLDAVVALVQFDKLVGLPNPPDTCLRGHGHCPRGQSYTDDSPLNPGNSSAAMDSQRITVSTIENF